MKLHKNAKDWTGKKFGRLLFIKPISRDSSRQIVWELKCDCGNELKTDATRVVNGNTSSCGCLQVELVTKRMTKHGLRIGNEKEYRAWKAIKQRCYNPNATNYRFYGEQGIQVHKDWMNSFPAFLKHIGKAPDSSYTIDRIDPFGNYEPNNVRWVTWEVQHQNTKRNFSKAKCPVK